jgi:hypothetical protein
MSWPAQLWRKGPHTAMQQTCAPFPSPQRAQFDTCHQYLESAKYGLLFCFNSRRTEYFHQYSHKYVSGKSLMTDIFVSWLRQNVIWMVPTNCRRKCYPDTTEQYTDGWLHTATVHCIRLHTATVHFVRLHPATVHFIQLHTATVHFIRLRTATVHFIRLHTATVHFIQLYPIPSTSYGFTLLRSTSQGFTLRSTSYGSILLRSTSYSCTLYRPLLTGLHYYGPLHTSSHCYCPIHTAPQQYCPLHVAPHCYCTLNTAPHNYGPLTGTTTLFHKSDIPPTCDGTGAWSIMCLVLPCALLTKFRPFHCISFHLIFSFFLFISSLLLATLTGYKHLVSAT